MTQYIHGLIDNADPGRGATRRRSPDPVEELATIDDKSPDNKPDRPHLSVTDGPQPGFGPDGTKQPKLAGDPTLGIDPREAAAGPKDDN